MYIAQLEGHKLCSTPDPFTIIMGNRGGGGGGTASAPKPNFFMGLCCCHSVAEGVSLAASVCGKHGCVEATSGMV